MKKNASPIVLVLAALTILIVPLAAYICSYFWLGEYREGIDGNTQKTAAIWRTFDQEWMTTIYQPAGRAEEWLRACDVAVQHTGDPNSFSYPIR